MYVHDYVLLNRFSSDHSNESDCPEMDKLDYSGSTDEDAEMFEPLLNFGYQFLQKADISINFTVHNQFAG